MNLTARELSSSGRGAISVIAVRGARALEYVACLTGLTDLASGHVRLARLTIDGIQLDELLVCVDSAEHVELHVHGSPPIVRGLLAHASAQGSSIGQTETQRTLAVAIEERAWSAVARAECDAAARVLLDQANGALRRAVHELADAAPPERARRAAELAQRGRTLKTLFRPPRVVLAGPTNAGKSTLFNLLVGEDRALVSEEHGTTRDVLYARARLGAYAIRLYDTAGERDLRGASSSSASVERGGQARARNESERADLVLWLDPLGRAPAPVSPSRVVVILSRADERAETRRDTALPSISARDAAAAARRTVADLFHSSLHLPREPWSPGAAVPFEPDLGDALMHVAESPSRGAPLAALLRMLGPAPDVACSARFP
ncbi:MAG: GTPase [Planctomycetota bacterium]